MARFESGLIEALSPECEKVSVWCVLPEHYHILVQCMSVSSCRKVLGDLHGRTAHRWNGEDDKRGRQCWYRCLPRPVRSERHRFATVNYVHHNPVHHGYAARWQDWPFSSAEAYLTSVGKKRAEDIWRQYPILDMGKNWDEPDFGSVPSTTGPAQS